MLKLNIKGTNINLDPLIYSHIEDKIGGLDKFIEEKEDSVVQAWVEVGISNKHHQTGDIYRAEVQIRLSGKDARAEAYAKDIFMAIDAVKDELQEELKKHRQKQEALYKRGARLVKRIFHFSPLARFRRKGKI